jgi:hypothetical protein
MTRPKVTYRGGRHTSREGEVLPDSVNDWLSAIVEIFRYRIRLRDDIESSANIRETLKRMTSITDDEMAATALDACDERSFGLLISARYRRHAPTDEGIAAGLRADAEKALENWKPDAGGRPEGVARELAGEILREWTRRTGEVNPPIQWHPDYEPPDSPVVRFAGVVFDDVFDEERPRDRSVIAKLLREAASTMG